jgi:hypothetical protein
MFTRRLLWIPAILFLGATCAEGDGEGDEGPPLDPVEACRGWVKAACQRTAECRLTDPATLATVVEECVAQNEKENRCLAWAPPQGCKSGSAAARDYRGCQRSAEQWQCKDCHGVLGCGFYCFLASCAPP